MCICETRTTGRVTNREKQQQTVEIVEMTRLVHTRLFVSNGITRRGEARNEMVLSKQLLFWNVQAKT